MNTTTYAQRTEVPMDNWEALAFYLQKYEVTRNREGKSPTEEARAFLLKGSGLTLPHRDKKITRGKSSSEYSSDNSGGNNNGSDSVTSNLDNATGEESYRLYPQAALNVINACIKLLAAQRRIEMRGESPTPDEEKILLGMITLADQLFVEACEDTRKAEQPLLHRYNDKPEEGKTIVLTKHGKGVQQAASFLSSYIEQRKESLKKKGINIEFPQLSCRVVVGEALQNSYQQRALADATDWKGSPTQVMESLESLKEGMGFEARAQTSNWDENEDIAEEEKPNPSGRVPASWFEIDTTGLKFQREEIRGNIITTSPESWIWDSYKTKESSSSISASEADKARNEPLGFVTNYINMFASPCLEEALTLIRKASENKAHENAAKRALILNANIKNNTSFWNIISKITSHFSSNSITNIEKETTIQKLDCARFTLCLRKTNIEHGIDPKQFEEAFKENVKKSQLNPKRKDTITRNEILLETALEINPEWEEKNAEMWLEHLQTSAVGAYENSTRIERRRNGLLRQLNTRFSVIREALEQAGDNNDLPQEIREKAAAAAKEGLTIATKAFYENLAGKIGQVTRRELNEKVKEVETVCRRNSNSDSTTLNTIDAIKTLLEKRSAQIKSGEWYNNEKENKEVIYNFLHLAAKTEKLYSLEFPGSKEPKSKDPLEITLDFIKSYSGEKGTKEKDLNTTEVEKDYQLNCGETKINTILKTWRELQGESDGGKLLKALKKVSKNNQAASEVIEKRPNLEMALTISKAIHSSNDGELKLAEMFDKEIEVLQTPINANRLPDPFPNPNEPTPPSFQGENLLGGEEGLEKAIKWLEFHSKAIEAKNKNLLSNARDIRGATRVVKASSIILLNVAKMLKNSPDKIKGTEDRILTEENKIRSEIEKRFTNNLHFWSALSWISQNIQSRREPELYQVKPHGNGSLKNIIAIARAKRINKDLARRDSGEQVLRQFLIGRDRKAELHTTLVSPIALWLSAKEKGTKTKITQEEFCTMLKERIESCKVCEQIMQSGGMEEKINEFQLVEKDNKIIANFVAVQECMEMLADPISLKEGIEWQINNPTKTIEMNKLNPELDTPNKKIALIKKSNPVLAQIDEEENITPELDNKNHEQSKKKKKGELSQQDCMQIS